ncbi:hypothetical protein F5Y16DRAFT_374812 [Xylariaceae sp. FL0255]|nr:hypothetical protein F5Y16DRAFT_374812 [Xylariaceae sp. FL0255]
MYAAKLAKLTAAIGLTVISFTNALPYNNEITSMGNETVGFEWTGSFATWAKFCDDENCTEGCGEPVSMSNPGCLNEGGRSSIQFWGHENEENVVTQGYIVVSPESDCDCQAYCHKIPEFDQGGCWNIKHLSHGNSFRFQSEPCNHDNCGKYDGWPIDGDEGR